MSMRAEDKNYTDLIKRLLPPGNFFKVAAAPGKLLYYGIEGMASEFRRIHNRVLDSLSETRITETTETIGTWEDHYGLPDAIFPMAETLAERRQIVQARMNLRGCNNDHDTKTLARSLNAEINMAIEMLPARVEEDDCEAALNDASGYFIMFVSGTVEAANAERVQTLLSSYKPAYHWHNYNLTSEQKDLT